MDQMTLYTAAFTLVLVMDPLGNIPVFLSILHRFDMRQQIRIIIREAIIAFVILVGFLFCGKYLMRWLGLTTPALSISGGIILFLIALRMIFPTQKRVDDSEVIEEPFIVPLAVPLTAGPSAMATVMLFASRMPHHTFTMFLAIAIASAVTLVTLLLAPFLMRMFGRRGLIAIERLMGMLLTALAIELFLEGIKQFFS